jgi:transforming growth factor-beta-induced protein
MIKRLTTLSLLSAVALAACADDPSPVAPEAPVAEGRFDNNAKVAGPTIADIAVAAATADENPQFTILVAALQAADLVDVFSGKGQFTVFAPTDEAFAAAFADLGIDANALLNDPEMLGEILKYHVAPGRRLSGSILGAKQIRTLQGGFLSPVVTDMGAFIRDGSEATRDAELLAAAGLIDLEASNGVIHVIDYVLIP